MTRLIFETRFTTVFLVLKFTDLLFIPFLYFCREDYKKDEKFKRNTDIYNTRKYIRNNKRVTMHADVLNIYNHLQNNYKLGRKHNLFSWEY